MVKETFQTNNFLQVGNDAGLDTAINHSIIKFESNENISPNDFSRTSILIRDFTGNKPTLQKSKDPRRRI